MKKILTRIVAIISLIVVGFVVFVLASWNKTYDAPFPDYKASKDPAIIERGRYLVHGPAHCGTCHIPMESMDDMKKGMQLPLSGGWELALPPGTVRAANLTPDMETGIGKLSDGELARAMRYSVNHRGKFMFPLMPFQHMSDEDVVAVISFLQSQAPVKHKVEHTEFTFLGKALLALGVVKPEGPKQTPPKMVFKEPTAAYGAYIANSVANCVGCHTKRDLKTGDVIGEPFAGGLVLPADVFSGGYSFMTPNITPDPETGIMATWTEEMFIVRFKNGRVYAGSHMPWESFSRMDTVDLKAVYAYLRSLDPVKNKIEKVAYKPGEVVPE